MIDLLGTIVVKAGSAVPTLSAALALARPHDTVVVEAGRYAEPPIEVTRPVVILGRGRPVFVGRGDHTVIRVTADSVTIAGIAVERVLPSNVAEPSAIRLDSVAHCRVADVEVRDSFFGIYGSAVESCLIENNRVVGPGRSEQESGNAIHLWSSRDVTVRGNVVERYRDGIYLEFVTGSRLEGNRSRDNRRFGLHFMFSDDCLYQENQFSRNGAGVAVMYSKQVRMVANRFEHNRGQAAYGLLLKDITDSRLEKNVFDANTIALYFEAANRVEAVENHFSSNGWAIRMLANSEANVVTGNAFVGNGFDVSTNSRSNASRFDGNFWDRYRGYDLDRDGFGDAPFRPVRLFSLVVEQNEPSLILLRSAFVDLLDAAERVLPILTPETLVDRRPLLAMPGRSR